MTNETYISQKKKCPYQDKCLDYPDKCESCVHNTDIKHYYVPANRKQIIYHDQYQPVWIF